MLAWQLDANPASLAAVACIFASDCPSKAGLSLPGSRCHRQPLQPVCHPHSSRSSRVMQPLAAQVMMEEHFMDRRTRFIITVASSVGIGIAIAPGWATSACWLAGLACSAVQQSAASPSMTSVCMQTICGSFLTQPPLASVQCSESPLGSCKGAGHAYSAKGAAVASIHKPLCWHCCKVWGCSRSRKSMLL